jgi:hypothetical protein
MEWIFPPTLPYTMVNEEPIFRFSIPKELLWQIDHISKVKKDKRYKSKDDLVFYSKQILGILNEGYYTFELKSGYYALNLNGYDETLFIRITSKGYLLPDLTLREIYDDMSIKPHTLAAYI